MVPPFVTLVILCRPDHREFILTPAAPDAVGTALTVSQARDPGAETDIQRETTQTIPLLNQLAGGPSAAGRGDRDPLLRLGRSMTRLYAPLVLEALRRWPPGSAITLLSDEPELPWELALDGADSLALRYVITRQIPSSQPQRPPVPATPGRWRALLVGNATGDLPHAEVELRSLARLIEARSDAASIDMLIRGRATRQAVLDRLARDAYDLVHFSTHVQALPGRPGEYAVPLAGGEFLTAADLAGRLNGQPIVFLNGCESVRMTLSAPDQVDLAELGRAGHGLALSWLQAGVRAVIGTLWPISDTGAQAFALDFYRLALRGEPIGEALRQARRTAYRETPGQPRWAASILFGAADSQLIATARQMHRPATVLAIQIRQPADWFAAQPADEAARQLADVTTRLADHLTRHGGVLNILTQDLVLGVFGFPVAHEHEAEQAVRAAHAITVVAGADWPGLALGLGVASGEVYASLSPTAPVPLLAGPTVAAAIALARQASPGVPLITDPVRRLVGPLLVVEPVPAAAGGGTVYRLRDLRTDPAPGRHAAWVGRADELAALTGAWQRAQSNRGQVVSVVGEAGIGKTRLLARFLGEIDATRMRLLQVACPVAYPPAPYEIVGQLFRALLNLEPGETTQELPARLDALLAHVIPAEPGGAAQQDSLALFSALLSPCPGAMPIGTAAQHRPRQLAVLLGKLLARLAAQTPLLVTLDDLHSADEASLDVLAQVVPGLDRLPVLVIGLLRSEAGWQAPWAERRNHCTVRLDVLDEATSRTLLATLLTADALPAEATHAILAQAGGNPLFMHELLTALLEAGALQKVNQTWRLAQPAGALNLPETLQRVILARLDRLPESARRLIETAAVIGDEVDPALLRLALAETREDSLLDVELRGLEEREFLHQRWDEASSYRFVHALLRSVAYENLEIGWRRRAHGRIGRALQAHYGDRAGEALELLAHHYDRSDDRPAALRYTLAAAQRAAATWANSAALTWFDRALRWAADFTARPADEAEQEAGATLEQISQWRVAALAGQADVLTAVGRTEEALPPYRQALAVLEADAGVPAAHRADLCRKLAIVYHNRGEFDRADEWLERGLATTGDTVSPEAGRLHVWRGMVEFRRGRLTEALTACEAGIVLLEQAASPRDLAQAYNLQGLVLRNLGRNAGAISAHERSIALYQELGDLAGVERAASNLGCAYQDLSRWGEALQCFERAAELCERTGEPWRQAAAAINLGEIYRRQGRLELALAAYARARRIGAEFDFPEVTGMALMDLGACHLKQAQAADAERCLAQSLAIFRQTGSDVYLPELLRYQAELQAQVGHAERALQVAQEALDWAITLERTLEEGQARRALGQAHRLLGQFEQAEDELRRSLAILEAQDSPYEVGLTLVEWAQLCEARAEAADDRASQINIRALRSGLEAAAGLVGLPERPAKVSSPEDLLKIYGGMADQLRKEAQAHCSRAAEIFERLGARMDLGETRALCKKIEGTCNNTLV